MSYHLSARHSKACSRGLAQRGVRGSFSESCYHMVRGGGVAHRWPREGSNSNIYYSDNPFFSPCCATYETDQMQLETESILIVIFLHSRASCFLLAYFLFARASRESSFYISTLFFNHNAWSVICVLVFHSLWHWLRTWKRRAWTRRLIAVMQAVQSRSAAPRRDGNNMNSILSFLHVFFP